MKKGNLSAKDRKRLARLKREIKEMDALAYKHDLDESWSIPGERLNSRYDNATKEIKKLKERA